MPAVDSREVEHLYEAWLRDSGAREVARPHSPAGGAGHLVVSARGDAGLVRLVASPTGTGTTLWVDAFESLGSGLELRAPALMRALADALAVSDAGMPVSPQALPVDAQDAAERLLGYLWSDARALPLVVCTRNAGEDVVTWRARADDLARTFAGAAVVVALGRAGEGLLRDRLGPHLGVWGGALRTYLPDVHPALGQEESYRLAPVLPYVRAREPSTAHRVLSRSISRVAFGRDAPPLPPATPGPAPRAEPGPSSVAVELQGGLAAALARLERTEGDVDRLDEAITLIGSRINALVDRLEQEDVLTPEQDDEEDPAQAVRRCGEAVVQAEDALEGLVIGADTWDAADRLDAHPGRGIWARRAWRALRALNEYVEARRGADPPASFLAFCHDTGAFYANRVTLRESATVQQDPRFRERRVFAVDAAVRQDSRVFMEAHVAIGSGEPPAPRLYFYDDTHGPTKKVHIGYLGEHLPNTRTN